MGVILVATILEVAVTDMTAMVIGMAINMVVSAVISNAFFNQNQPTDYAVGQSPNPGNRQQVPPATNNKLDVVYGDAYVGGTMVDLSISDDNQQLYYVFALSEVTNTNTGQTPDTITFGNMYFGGKKVIFQGNGYTVASLLDESTGLYDTSVNGLINVYFYSNGSFTPTNSTRSAIDVMSTPGLIYTWDNTKLMTNCAFAIVHLTYNRDASITGIQQTKFEVINSRNKPGDCIYDYLTNTRYGGAIPTNQINTNSLAVLNAYSDELINFTDFNGDSATQKRFQFDGVVDTNRTIMQNIQDMASCCDALIRYNEITAQWGVITQKPTYSIAMDINNSNMVSAITISPIDIANSFNVCEVKFPDNPTQDSFNSSTIDLAVVDPALLYPNEPVNKQSIALPYVNNNVRAQYLGNRFLKSAREDLQITVTIGYVGIQLEAGDVVTVTNANYGFVAKLFRVNKVTENFSDTGALTASLILSEFNPAVYDDMPITQFQPAPNSGIGSPTNFGTLYAPVVVSEYPTAVNPYFMVQVETASSGITQYAEIWYSAFSSPLTDQLIFAGTSQVQSNGTPWSINTVLPLIELANIPSGDWYFFTRMVNSLGTSVYSPASAVFRWRPKTFQYSQKYLVVAYADDINGGGFNLSPTNKEYYGLLNQNNISPSLTPSDYTWYLADPNFGTEIFLAYSNRTGRKFSFATGFADYAASTGAFVPTQTAIFDPSIWAALPNGINYIDLDVRTGQLIESGTTTVGTGEIAVQNNADGKVVASLKQYLDFGGAYQYTSSAATITVDIYGRVVGFEPPDGFLYSDQDITATAGQTVFNVTGRTSGHYIPGNCWVLINGILQSPSTYTDASTTVTLSTGTSAGDIVSILSFTGETLAPTTYYNAFTINSITLNNVSSYDFTGSGITLNSGYEVLFLNGTIMPAQDYDIIGQIFTNFPNVLTGELTIIQFTPNNLGTPAGNPVNLSINSIIGQSSYPFSNNPLSINIYQNGVSLAQGVDFTDTTSGYTLANTPITIDLLTQQTFARTGSA